MEIHPKADSYEQKPEGWHARYDPTRRRLESDPGIGHSKGATIAGADLRDFAGDNMVGGRCRQRRAPERDDRPKPAGPPMPGQKTHENQVRTFERKDDLHKPEDAGPFSEPRPRDPDDDKGSKGAVSVREEPACDCKLRMDRYVLAGAHTPPTIVVNRFHALQKISKLWQYLATTCGVPRWASALQDTEQAMRASEAIEALEEGSITDDEALELSGCVSLLDLYERAAEEQEQDMRRPKKEVPKSPKPR